MRLQSSGSDEEASEIKKFSDRIASIGDGLVGIGDNVSSIIEIPDDMLLDNSGDPIATIVENTYSSLSERINDPDYLQQRAILAPTFVVVDSINQYMISKNTGANRSYYSSDSATKLDMTVDVMTNVHTPEFLNAIKCSGIPNHELILKVGAPVMLLRNIDPTLGLCNGMRLILIRLGSHVLETTIMLGANAGHKILIPRLSLTPSDPKLPFKFQRRQFPINVSYVMTINKSQGQSLSHVGLFFKKPVFSHGLLYVAFSRVTNRYGLKILICDDKKQRRNSTVNVVYREVFKNV